jgi:hypothetical protein
MLPFVKSVVIAVVILATAVFARAAEWDSIVPGQSTFDTVRARLGEPGSRKTEKVEGYDTTEWIYEGERSPRGIRRLTVAFGILRPDGFKPNLVRTFRLEPSPGVFTEPTILAGWGPPSAAGREGDFPALLYEDGLIVIFERDAYNVQQMIFTVPQKRP